MSRTIAALPDEKSASEPRTSKATRRKRTTHNKNPRARRALLRCCGRVHGCVAVALAGRERATQDEIEQAIVLRPRDSSCARETRHDTAERRTSRRRQPDRSARGEEGRGQPVRERCDDIAARGAARAPWPARRRGRGRNGRRGGRRCPRSRRARRPRPVRRGAAAGGRRRSSNAPRGWAAGRSRMAELKGSNAAVATIAAIARRPVPVQSLH